MAAKKGKKKGGSVDLAFMELAPLDEDEDAEDLDEDEFEEDDGLEEEPEDDLDEEGRMLAETVLGDGDMETRAQALKDFVKHCMAQGDGY